MCLQEEAVFQESNASVIAEEEWSNAGFNVSKADEWHGGEKGEQEIRGEKESREVRKTRGRPPKVSSVWYSTPLLVFHSTRKCPHTGLFLLLCTDKPCNAAKSD